MTDIDALRRETERLIDGDWDTEDLQDHICDLQTALDERQWQPMETCPIAQKVLICDSRQVYCGRLQREEFRGDPHHTAWQPLPEPPK